MSIGAEIVNHTNRKRRTFADEQIEDYGNWPAIDDEFDDEFDFEQDVEEGIASRLESLGGDPEDERPVRFSLGSRQSRSGVHTNETIYVTPDPRGVECSRPGHAPGAHTG